MKVRVGTHVLSLNGSSKTSPTEKSVTQALNTAIKTQLYKKSPMLLAFMFSHFLFVSLLTFWRLSGFRSLSFLNETLISLEHL